MYDRWVRQLAGNSSDQGKCRRDRVVKCGERLHPPKFLSLWRQKQLTDNVNGITSVSLFCILSTTSIDVIVASLA